jgi:hypothetical protein
MVGFKVVRYIGEGFNYEPKYFSVDGIEGRLANDTLMFNTPRIIDRMIVVIN